MNSDGSSSRSALDGNTPPLIGTVTCFPVRSSMMVMVSGTLLVPSWFGECWGLPPRRGTLLPGGAEPSSRWPSGRSGCVRGRRRRWGGVGGRGLRGGCRVRGDGLRRGFGRDGGGRRRGGGLGARGL